MPTKKVLVADDDPKFLAMLTLRLSRAGYEVIQAHDGYQAVHHARVENPDLLLLDINMPAGDGFSVFDRISRAPDVRAMPTIYITGDAAKGTPAIAKKHGAYAVIRKPFEAGDLLCTIREALEYAEEQLITS